MPGWRWRRSRCKRTRIRIGALVTPLPRRRPWKLARETVSVDHLSGGRLIFAAGTGDGEAEFEHLGEQADPRVRGAMLDEGLDVLTGLWRGEPFSYDGHIITSRTRCFSRTRTTAAYPGLDRGESGRTRARSPGGALGWRGAGLRTRQETTWTNSSACVQDHPRFERDLR